MERSFQRPSISSIKHSLDETLACKAPLIYSSIERVAGIIECRDPYVNGKIDPYRARETLINRGATATVVYIASSLLLHKAKEIFRFHKSNSALVKRSE